MATRKEVEAKMEELKKALEDGGKSLKEMQKFLDEHPEDTPEVKDDKSDDGMTFDEFCNQQDFDTDEKHALDKSCFYNVHIEKNLTGKYRVIFGKSTLCVCNHPTKAIAVANAMSMMGVHFKNKGTLHSIMKKLDEVFG